MNDQERQVISDIFQRLEQVAHQPRDPEAERFIAEKIRQQPYAPYALAQAVFVQEQALASLNQQVQQLQAEVEHLRQRPQSSGGFLSSIFGGGSSREAPHQRSSGAPFGQPHGAPQTGGAPGPWGGPGAQPGYQPGYPGGPSAGPWGGQPGMMGQPGPFGAARQGGGFMGTALATAAGVAGGMMVGSALANAFGGDSPAGNALAGGLGGEGAQGASDHSSLSPFGNAGGGGDASLEDASADAGESFDDEGGDDWT